MAKIALVAPSSMVPKNEVLYSIQFLKSKGHKVVTAKNLFKSDWSYAGNDHERAKEFLSFAYNKSIDTIWVARGGYGATHLLPFLKSAQKLKGKPPKKTLLGFSDVTALHAFCGPQWGWHTIHAPMPATRFFTKLNEVEQSRLDDLLDHTKPEKVFQFPTINVSAMKQQTTLPIYGGNLAVWCSLLGTPYFPKLKKDHFLFFEDIQETPSRTLRMLHQLYQAESFRKCKGVIFGTFTDCKDGAPLGLKNMSDIRNQSREWLIQPPANKLQKIRSPLNSTESMTEVFQRFSKLVKLPVVYNFPCGHGPDQFPLALQEPITWTKNGTIIL